MNVAPAKPPQWFEEHLEGLEFLEKERVERNLEKQLPGIKRIFEHLIALLPDPNNVYGNTTEFPVAASVIRKGANGKVEVVSTATNQVNTQKDSSAHAEVVALREAEQITGEKHLKGHYLLTTMEPCVMCSGAAINTEVDGVIYGATHDDVRGSHALVGKEYKPWRTSNGVFDTDSYLTDSGLLVVREFMEPDVLSALHRTAVSMKEYYGDPDA